MDFLLGLLSRLRPILWWQSRGMKRKCRDLESQIAAFRAKRRGLDDDETYRIYAETILPQVKALQEELEAHEVPNVALLDASDPDSGTQVIFVNERLQRLCKRKRLAR